jgi:hypothetical protein
MPPSRHDRLTPKLVCSMWRLGARALRTTGIRQYDHQAWRGGARERRGRRDRAKNTPRAITLPAANQQETAPKNPRQPGPACRCIPKGAGGRQRPRLQHVRTARRRRWSGRSSPSASIAVSAAVRPAVASAIAVGSSGSMGSPAMTTAASSSHSGARGYCVAAAWRA